MSQEFWQKISRIFGLFPIAALFGLLFFSASLEVKDLDLWLHLTTGKFITENGFIPTYDFLSHTIAGHPWNNHEWLFQIVVYNIYSAWGADGLIAMQMVLVTLTMMLLLFIGYNRDRQFLTAFILLLTYLVYQHRFTIRPDLFSLFFFSAYIYVLALHIDKKWAALALFFVQVVWTNMHGFFFFGPLIVFLGIVSEWIKRHVRLPYEWNECGRLNDSEYQRLKFVFIVVVLGCLLNPQFAEGALYPLTVFFSLSGENSIFFDYIQELQKPITWSSLFDVTHFIYFKIMILVSFASFIFCRRRIDISALILWIIFLIFSLKAMRNMPFFAFAAYLVFVTNLMYISSEDVIPIRFSDPKFLHLTSIIGKLFLTLWILAYFQDISVRGYYDFDKHERKSEFGGVSQRNFPNKAVDFLVEHNIKGNFFNDFNSGAYLIGRAWPNIKVFIDGRTEVYGGEFFKFYQKIWDKGDGDVFEEAVGRYKITGVFLNSIRQHIPEELLRYLYTHEDWKVVYFDYDGMIFLKDIPVNRPIIDQYEIDLTKWEAQEEDLLKIGATKVKPFRNYYRAFTLDALDLYGPAMAEAQAAIKLSPSSANVYKLIGQIYAKQKRFRDAFEYFRAAAVIDSDDQETRYNLARAYLDMEEYDGAVKQYEIIRDRWPSDPRSWFVLSKAYAKNKKYIKAYDTLVQALHMKPGNIGDAAQIGDVVFEDQQYKEAILFYSLLLKINPNLWEIHQKIGQAQEALGDIPAAKNAFRMALSINPENENLKKTLTRLEHISRGDQ